MQIATLLNHKFKPSLKPCQVPPQKTEVSKVQQQQKKKINQETKGDYIFSKTLALKLSQGAVEADKLVTSVSSRDSI